MAFSATRVDTILTEIGRLNPRAIIVDSIQTVYLDEIPSSAGSVTQVMPVVVSATVGAHCLSFFGREVLPFRFPCKGWKLWGDFEDFPPAHARV